MLIGYKLNELTPNKTRRAQLVNWLIYYRGIILLEFENFSSYNICILKFFILVLTFYFYNLYYYYSLYDINIFGMI